MSYACVTLYEPVATGHDLPETHRETMKRKEKQMGIQDVEDFEQNTLTEGDKLATRDVKGLPLLVYVVKRLEGLNTKHGNNKPGLICDILDLTTGTPYTHVLWMNNQVIDNLSKYEGKAVPIRIEEKHSNKTGNDYLLPVALEGQERQTANDWAKARPDIFDTDRAAKGYPTVSEVQGGLGASVSVGTGNTAPAAAPAAAPAPAPAPTAAPAPAAAAPSPAPAPAAPAPAAAPAPVAAPVAAPAAPVAAPAPAAPPQAAAAPAPVADPANDDLPF